jgi:hypothetical protein
MLFPLWGGHLMATSKAAHKGNVRAARKALDWAQGRLYHWIREAHAAGVTTRELEEPSGLKKSRIAQIVKGEGR